MEISEDGEAILDSGVIRLTDAGILEKIGKLRKLSAQVDVPHPLIVSIGQPSAGKSSVLTNLTGISFPQGPGLCTRFATEVTCQQDDRESVVVSINPFSGADELSRQMITRFVYRFDRFDNEEIQKLWVRASTLMGIRNNTGDRTPQRSNFSQHTLKIEIRGPMQDHITIVDIPGIFDEPSPGLTLQSDIGIVEKIAGKYLNNPRAIILWVQPCQDIGKTTNVVRALKDKAAHICHGIIDLFTKPDLLSYDPDVGTFGRLFTACRGPSRNPWYVVKYHNAPASDNTDDDGLGVFWVGPYLGDLEHCGFGNLKVGIQNMLTSRFEKEMRLQKADIRSRLVAHRATLAEKELYPDTLTKHSEYLGTLAHKIQLISRAAIREPNPAYEGSKLQPRFKLAAKIINLNRNFARVLELRGHSNAFGTVAYDDYCDLSDDEILSSETDTKRKHYPELWDICMRGYKCPEHSEELVATSIKKHFESNPELDSKLFDVFSAILQEQTEKWEPLVLSYTSSAVILVHDFIKKLLEFVCPMKQVRGKIWSILLTDKLCETYRKALSHARLLVLMELNGQPVTFSERFPLNPQKEGISSPATPVTPTLKRRRSSSSQEGTKFPSEIKVQQMQFPTKTQADIYHYFVSYYNKARKRLVDAVCNQVVFHFLLGADGPLFVFSPQFIRGLTDQQLAATMGDVSGIKKECDELRREIKNLEEVLTVLVA